MRIIRQHIPEVCYLSLQEDRIYLILVQYLFITLNLLHSYFLISISLDFSFLISSLKLHANFWRAKWFQSILTFIFRTHSLICILFLLFPIYKTLSSLPNISDHFLLLLLLSLSYLYLCLIDLSHPLLFLSFLILRRNQGAKTISSLCAINRVHWSLPLARLVCFGANSPVVKKQSSRELHPDTILLSIRQARQCLIDIMQRNSIDIISRSLFLHFFPSFIRRRK